MATVRSHERRSRLDQQMAIPVPISAARDLKAARTEMGYDMIALVKPLEDLSTLRFRST